MLNKFCRYSVLATAILWQVHAIASDPVTETNKQTTANTFDTLVMDNPYLAKGWYRESAPGLGEYLRDKGIVYRGLMLGRQIESGIWQDQLTTVLLLTQL